jgi:hypothetical protein
MILKSKSLSPLGPGLIGLPLRPLEPPWWRRISPRSCRPAQWSSARRSACVIREIKRLRSRDFYTRGSFLYIALIVAIGTGGTSPLSQSCSSANARQAAAMRWYRMCWLVSCLLGQLSTILGVLQTMFRLLHFSLLIGRSGSSGENSIKPKSHSVEVHIPRR